MLRSSSLGWTGGGFCVVTGRQCAGNRPKRRHLRAAPLVLCRVKAASMKGAARGWIRGAGQVSPKNNAVSGGARFGFGHRRQQGHRIGVTRVRKKLRGGAFLD